MSLAESTNQFDYYCDTSSVSSGSDIDGLRKLGEAMILGKQVIDLQNDSGAGLGEISGYKGLVSWLSQDFLKNSKLVRKVAIELAVGRSPWANHVVRLVDADESPEDDVFKSEMTSLISSIRSNESLTVSRTTMLLAKQVAEMEEPKESDVQKWAETLGEQIGKGRD